MANIQLWVLSGALSLALIVLGFLSQSWFKSIIAQLKEIAKTLAEIKESIISHEKDIEYIKIEQARMNERLDNHGNRIHELETKN